MKIKTFLASSITTTIRCIGYCIISLYPALLLFWHFQWVPYVFILHGIMFLFPHRLVQHMKNSFSYQSKQITFNLNCWNISLDCGRTWRRERWRGSQRVRWPATSMRRSGRPWSRGLLTSSKRKERGLVTEGMKIQGDFFSHWYPHFF